MTAGPLGLVGSGEFTPATEAVDLRLLEGRPQRAVYLPTAAAPEGEEVFQRWATMGARHYERLGVDAALLPVRTRADADDPALAAQLDGAGLIYLSGGDPVYLAATLSGSAVGEAMRVAWMSGTAVAGCSAVAVALMSH